jgi:hypothetical protein
VSDPDAPNVRGPDTRNVREGDKTGVPEAPPPTPPRDALEDDQIAPDV